MDSKTERRAAYWRRNLTLVGTLLAVWFVVSFGFGIMLVEPLNAVKIGGFPLGFWIAQQGSILVFVALVFIYARRMDRLERSDQLESDGEER